MNTIVFMFSGQGSQYYHMGKELFEDHPVFREWMLELDAIAQLTSGQSILKELYSENRKKSDLFNQTPFTHPAIFMEEYALAQVLLKMGIVPDYVMGTSIGEFAAAALANVLSYGDTLTSLIKQAEVLESHCEKGGMLAVLHDPGMYYNVPFVHKNSEMVSINFHSHFVISGSADRLRSIEQYLKENRITFQALPVSQAFHSSCIDPAGEIYMDFLNQKTFRPPQIPFLSCAYATVLKTIDNSYFWEVIRRPIEFQKTLLGLEKREHCIYLDLGPSGTLANFVKYNLDRCSESKSYTILSPFGNDLNNFIRLETILTPTF